MSDETKDSLPSGPVRVARLYISSADASNSTDETVHFTADLDPGLPSLQAQQWWRQELQSLVPVRGGSWSPSTGAASLRVVARRDQIETVARQLLVAIEELNVEYPERYEAWMVSRAERRREEEAERLRLCAAEQARLDEVMDEYRSKG